MEASREVVFTAIFIDGILQGLLEDPQKSGSNTTQNMKQLHPKKNSGSRQRAGIDWSADETCELPGEAF